ncbi:MAG: HDOD domain-containing protein [Deltaproteobacteria bacterium]|nr:HDOD domain-containing protein [Deltaproteobacteria bacterium]
MSLIPVEIIDSIEAIHLPTIPQTLLRFLQLADDEKTSMAELAALVSQDPALSARVLTVANSPALKCRAESKSLVRSLTNIGTRLARTLAACLVVQKVFSPAIDNQDYDFTGFWGHSLRVAEVARALAVEINYPDVDEAYLAGLLHDIGQLLLLGGLRGRYGLLLAASSDETYLRDCEKKELGTNHSAVGAWLVDQWNISSFMADAILFHHTAADEIVAADTLSRIIWSAHKICHHYTASDHLQQEQDTDFATIYSTLGVDTSKLFTLYQQCSAQITQVASALGISESVDAKTLPYSTTVPLEILRPPLKTTDTATSQMTVMVHDMAMLQPLQRGLASLQSETEILLSIRESAWILFGPGQLAFLLVQPEEAVLSGANISGQPTLLQQIRIPLESYQSLAAGVALGKDPYSTTFEQKSPATISLADVQITRILGSEGLLYIPLKGRSRTIGVMAYGISASQYHRLKTRLPLLSSFATMAATSLDEWREVQEREHKLTTTLTNNFELQARKVIHEAGNPLGIIKNYLEIVRKRLPDHGSILHEVNILGEEIDRVTHIIRRMGDLTSETNTVGTVDINAVIDSMVVLYGDSLFSGHGIIIEKELDPELSAVTCDRDSIKQILFNLWNNASDAITAGGYFVISTHDNINQDGRSYIEIRLSDTGPGLPPEVMQHLFQPLGPDRCRPGHAGLGLSIVAALVEQLEGRITCQSKAGRGTRFSILLPKSGKA